MSADNRRAVVELGAIEADGDEVAIFDRRLGPGQEAPLFDVKGLAARLHQPVQPNPLQVLLVRRRVPPQVHDSVDVPPRGSCTRSLNDGRPETLFGLQIMAVAGITPEEKELRILHPAISDGTGILDGILRHGTSSRLWRRRNL